MVNLAALSTFCYLWIVLRFADATCTCTKQGLVDSFRDTTYVFKAETIDVLKDAADGSTLYETRNLLFYKPCPSNIPIGSVVITTKSSGCGVKLEAFQTYLFTGDLDHRLIVDTNTGPKTIYYISISQCHFASVFSKLTSVQKTKLRQLHDKLDCKPVPVQCNATSCGIANLPLITACPGLNNTYPQVICTYLNTTKACGYEILPCPSSR